MKKFFLIALVLSAPIAIAETSHLPKEFIEARKVLDEAHHAKVEKILPKTMHRAETYYAHSVTKYKKSLATNAAATHDARELANEARALAEDALVLTEDVRSWDNDMQEYLEMKSLMDMDFHEKGELDELSKNHENNDVLAVIPKI